MNKKIATLIIVVLAGFGIFYLARDPDPEPATEAEKELALEETLNEIDTIFELEEDLLALEEAGVISEGTVEEYYDLENRYFILIDNYYEGDLSREELNEEVDKLLRDIEELEEKITNLNN